MIQYHKIRHAVYRISTKYCTDQFSMDYCNSYSTLCVLDTFIGYCFVFGWRAAAAATTTAAAAAVQFVSCIIKYIWMPSVYIFQRAFANRFIATRTDGLLGHIIRLRRARTAERCKRGRRKGKAREIRLLAGMPNQRRACNIISTRFNNRRHNRQTERERERERGRETERFGRGNWRTSINRRGLLLGDRRSLSSKQTSSTTTTL